MHVLANYGIRLARRAARHAAAVLRARKPQVARHGQSRRAPSVAEDDHLRRGDRQRRQAHSVRAGERRGRRPNTRPRTPTSRCACTARCSPDRARREALPHLSRHRNAGHARALADGAQRRAARREAARRALARVRRQDARDRGESARAGGPAVQSQFAAPDPGDPVRQAQAAGHQENAVRHAVDRRRRARAARARSPAAEADPRISRPVEAEVDLHRQARRHDQSGDRPRAHVLFAGGRGDRAAFEQRSQSAEHPDPHGRRTAHPRGVHRRRPARTSCRRTTRRSSCASWRTSRATRACSRRLPKARTSIARPRRRFSAFRPTS